MSGLGEAADAGMEVTTTTTTEGARRSTNDIETIVAGLDGRFRSWELFNRMKGPAPDRWSLTAHTNEACGRTSVPTCNEATCVEVNGPTIESALIGALGWVPSILAVIPPRPPATPTDRSAVKSGRSWTPTDPEFFGSFKTKREAVAWIEECVVKMETDRAEWSAKFGDLVATGVEGVDYRFESWGERLDRRRPARLIVTGGGGRKPLP